MSSDVKNIKRKSQNSILGSLGGWGLMWPKPTKKSLRKWVWISLEVAVAMAAILIFRLWVAPHDVFGVDADFPWLWLLPTLFAMRYGAAVGIGATILLFLTWLIHQNFVGEMQALDAFPKEYFIGGLILNLISGQFSDVWTARIHRLESANDYFNERLGTLTRKHYLLRLSHERLEQELLTKPSTLREALLRLRKLSISGSSRNTILPGSMELMQLLGENCQIENASLFIIEDGKLRPKAVASQGSVTALNLEDSLVKYCLVQKSMVHIQTQEAWVNKCGSSKYLICAPLVSSKGELLAMVTVEKMPFFALNEKTLELLSVLTGYYADGLVLASATSPILDHFPECPDDIALDIVRLHRIYSETEIVSSLVAIVFDFDSDSEDMLAQIKRIKRNIDLAWEFKSSKRRVLVTLLPLAGKAAVEGYLIRINHALHSKFGASYNENKITTYSASLGENPALATLKDLLVRCE